MQVQQGVREPIHGGQILGAMGILVGLAVAAPILGLIVLPYAAVTNLAGAAMHRSGR